MTPGIVHIQLNYMEPQINSSDPANFRVEEFNSTEHCCYFQGVNLPEGNRVTGNHYQPSSSIIFHD